MNRFTSNLGSLTLTLDASLLCWQELLDVDAEGSGGLIETSYFGCSRSLMEVTETFTSPLKFLASVTSSAISPSVTSSTSTRSRVALFPLILSFLVMSQV